MSRTLTVGILFVSWFCIVSVTEAALGTSCNEIADPSDCAENESCTNSICVCSEGYFNVSGKCESNSISVTLQADSNSKVYGSSVILTATITSAVPVDTVQWQKEEKNIDINQEKYTQSNVGSNKVTLTITNLVTNDGGSYRVQVNNSAGTISDWSIPVTLTVTGVVPTVTVPGTITETDTTVTIDCTASVSQGSPALTSVYWLFKGANLSSSESNKYSGGNLNTKSLTINSIGPTDAGEYRCVATNPVGSTTSSQSVNLAPPSNVAVTQQPSSSIIHGSKVTFTGSYSSALLNVKDIKWQIQSGSGYIDIDINGNVKYNGSNVTGSSPKLIINPVRFIDETSYQLVVSNGVGSASSSFLLIIENGELTVTIGPGVNGRIGGSVTINCNVNGPEPSKVQWVKYINGNQVNIIIDGLKYSGGSTSSPNLIINSLNVADAAHYECTASNQRGTFRSATKAKVTLNYGQFNEDCSNTEPCDSSKKLICTSNKCLCMSTYYHKEEVCYEQKRLVPTNIYLNSTTSSFFVSWSPPNTDSELVSEYEVKWRVLGTAVQTSGRLSKSKNIYNVSTGLISGHLYIVNVISHVSLTSPTKQIPVISPDTTVRTVPLAPGPIKNESHFAHNDLQIKWTAPVNTVVTKYEVTIDGTTYTTMSSDAMYQFTGKVFVPGKLYDISIVTVSGTTSDIVKKSSEHTESIRTTPRKPNPPTNLQCPQSPMDISLEITWTAPTEPNGRIFRYQINVSSKDLDRQVYTSSDETQKNVEGLSPEQMYSFTVRTINDAVDYTSEPSQQLNCTTKIGVSTAPTNLNIDEVQSRRFKIRFNRPDDVKGILAAYKIVIIEGGKCVQQIIVQDHCSTCLNTDGCPPPINYNFPDITNNDVSYTASGLMPYTYYMVEVVAINGKGEGPPVNATVTTDEEVPQQPEQITASNFQSSTLTLSWTLPDPSPGNTTYTIYTYEGTDDIGTSFLMNRSTKVYGFDIKTLLVTGLEEYWPYRFKVNAATVKGNTISDFSSIFRTKQSDPGRVLNLIVQQKGNDYKSAYVSWSPPALKDHNGVLKSYSFSINHTGTMNEEEIPVLLSQITVMKKIPVMPEAVYLIKVVLQNNESMNSPASMQAYRAPAGPPPVTDIEPVTTKPGEHRPTTNTITVDINTEYFKKGDNGKQVFFGIAVCAKSNCVGIDQNTYKNVWKDLPNWHNAHKKGFPLYRVTNDTFMDGVNQEDSRQKRTIVSVSTIKFIVGEDQTCPSLNENVYCNGPLTAGTSYSVIIFACTNGGCTYSKAEGSFATIKQTMVVPNYGPIIGSVVAVTFFLAVTVSGILLWKRNRRHKIEKEYKEQADTYADLNLDECTKADQPYSLLEHGSRNVKSKSVPLNSFFDYVVDLLRNNRQKLTKEYHDLLQNTERAASTVASSKNNTSKNRGNIIPYDFNRVKLCSPGANDYIDASVVLDKFYILTSFPFAKTFGNFWQMIWEQNVSTIVVITGQSDDRESWYFSDNEGTLSTIEKFDVELLAKFNSTESVTMRKIKLSRGRHSKVVNHFHVISLEMTDLPDQILALINTITQNNVKNTGPQVVHGGCTGVDNSGVYIAVDHAVKSVVSGGNEIDVYGTARAVMKERMFSISSLEQYSAIYTCLQKYVQNSPACKNDATGTYEYLP